MTALGIIGRAGVAGAVALGLGACAEGLGAPGYGYGDPYGTGGLGLLGAGLSPGIIYNDDRDYAERAYKQGYRDAYYERRERERERLSRAERRRDALRRAERKDDRRARREAERREEAREERRERRLARTREEEERARRQAAIEEVERRRRALVRRAAVGDVRADAPTRLRQDGTPLQRNRHQFSER